MREIDNNIAISYNGIPLTQSVVQSLPVEVKEWLSFYNSLSADEQDAITYVPAELVPIVTEKGILAAGKTVFAAGIDANPPIQVYNAQGYLLYNPDYWNERRNMANCYAYAMNVVVNGDDFRLRPGNVRGMDISRPSDDLEKIAVILAANVIDDSLSGNLGEITNAVRCEFTDNPNRTNQYRVALAMGCATGDVERKFKDYHWYREDSAGMWSHKRGGQSITKLDANGNPISTEDNPPHLCARRYSSTDYSHFACYFMITHAKTD